ncbi:MAG: abortive infection system antitoxin AbiGi family protein [Candidatus Acidiferrales bacterium]
MNVQRYVSNELTHFVGGNCNRDQQRQFGLLEKILYEGILKPPPTGGFADGFTLGVVHGGKLAGNRGLISSVVCFCDIPIADISIHTRKYSLFGIAFTKSFMLAKGASPVFYVARDASAPYATISEDETPNLEDAWEKVYRNQFKTTKKLEAYLKRQMPGKRRGSLILSSDRPGTTSPGGLLYDLDEISHALNNLVYSNLKFFNGLDTDLSKDNFYMEREWRVRGELKFKLKDVTRIILPRRFARRLRERFPSFCGQVEFSNKN